MTTPTQMRGTCPACFNDHALRERTGEVTRHGWQETGRRVGASGYGNQWGECFGVARQPFELTPEGTRQFRMALTELRVQKEREARRLATRPELTVSFSATRSKEAWKELFNAGDEKYDGVHAARTRQADAEVASLKAHIAELSKAIKGWKLGMVRATTAKPATLHMLSSYRANPEGDDGESPYETLRLPRDGEAKIGYCGSGRSIYGSASVPTTENRDEVTCARCLKALAKDDEILAQRARVKADAAKLAEHLRTDGPRTAKKLKADLGWDQKRLNKAADAAGQKVRRGYESPAVYKLGGEA